MLLLLLSWTVIWISQAVVCHSLLCVPWFWPSLHKHKEYFTYTVASCVTICPLYVIWYEYGCSESEKKTNIISTLSQFINMLDTVHFVITTIILVATFLYWFFSERHQSWHLLWMLSRGIYFPLRELSP